MLPLQFLGASEEEAHLAPGLAEEITTALSRFRWMFVVASSSLARFATETRDEGAIRRTFGIDFLLDGSIQRVRNRLRITVRLLDLRAGNQVVWARRFDRQTNDLLTLQDEIAAEVVAQIDPEILLIEARRSAVAAAGGRHRLRPRAARHSADVAAWSGRRSCRRASYLAQAIELEPDYAAAYAWYAYWHVFLVGQGWAEDPRAVMERAGATRRAGHRARSVRCARR